MDRIRYFRLVEDFIDPPKKGEFLLSTAAVWPCALCGRTIDGMGGPGYGEVCGPCGDEMQEGRLRGSIIWEDDGLTPPQETKP